MYIRWILIGISFLVLLQALSAASELYQYKDKNGNLHFTDNPTDIPDDQRANAKSIQEIPASETNHGQKDQRTNTSAPQNQVPDDSTWNGKLQQKAKSLENQRSELNQKYETLRSEKQSLGGPPPASASHAEKREYQRRVEELNRKITAYKKQKNQFEEQVSDFKDKTRGNQ